MVHIVVMNFIDTLLCVRWYVYIQHNGYSVNTTSCLTLVSPEILRLRELEAPTRFPSRGLTEARW